MSISGLSASLLASAKAFCRGSILIAMSVYPDCSAFADFFKFAAKLAHHCHNNRGTSAAIEKAQAGIGIGVAIARRIEAIELNEGPWLALGVMIQQLLFGRLVIHCLLLPCAPRAVGSYTRSGPRRAARLLAVPSVTNETVPLRCSRSAPGQSPRSAPPDA